MNVLHVCLAGMFSEGYAYQDNIMTKYHKKAGHDVEVITSIKSLSPEGNIVNLSQENRYINKDGVRVVRLLYEKPTVLSKHLRRYKGLFETINDYKPDVIYVHGIQFYDMKVVIQYASMYPNVKVFADNHADFKNSARSLFSRKVMHEFLWRRIAQKSINITQRFYGVLPARVDFLIDVYKLPKEKCKLLVMGADDELAERAIRHRKEGLIRKEYGIHSDVFLIVAGGKLNSNRPEMLNLMEAVKSMNGEKVKLLVFGNVADEYKQRFEELCRSDSIINAGWQNSENTYDLMAAGDLIVFPGLHSVMWEQAVALGVPCLFKQIGGFDHVDIGGNARFLTDVSTKGLKNAIRNIVQNKRMYYEMLTVAQSNKRKKFMYSRIAEEAINEE